LKKEGPYLIADDSVGLLIEENWDGKPTSVVWFVGEIDFSNMGIFRMQRVGNGVLPREIFIGSSKAPSCKVNIWDLIDRLYGGIGRLDLTLFTKVPVNR